MQCPVRCSVALFYMYMQTSLYGIYKTFDIFFEYKFSNIDFNLKIQLLASSRVGRVGSKICRKWQADICNVCASLYKIQLWRDCVAWQWTLVTVSSTVSDFVKTSATSSTRRWKRSSVVEARTRSLTSSTWFRRTSRVYSTSRTGQASSVVTTDCAPNNIGADLDSQKGGGWLTLYW